MQHILTGIHSQLLGQVVAQQGCLTVLKVGKTGLVALELIGKYQQFCPVGGFLGEAEAVTFLKLLFTGHTQTLLCDFLEVAFVGDEQSHGIIGDLLFLCLGLNLVNVINDFRLTGLTVLVGNGLQLLLDNSLQLAAAIQDLLELRNLLFQLGGCLGLLQDVFTVDIAKLDLRHKVGLNLVDAEADHQIGNYLIFQFGFPDDRNGLINIQQDPFQTFQQMQTILFLLNLEEQPSADAFHTPCSPLLQNFTHTHDSRHAGNEDIEVTGKCILQACKTE